MNNDVPDIEPICELCNNAVMTVKHMIECEQLINDIRKYPRLWRPGRVTNMRELLGRSIMPGTHYVNAHLCTSLRLSVKKNCLSVNPDTL